ncbi:hypothetical protein BDR03DRAFT_947330 [Suillus americanus]|nr:hypothetical protein BDR03DRAFT_947330 [Suillus americanus]
MPSGAEGASTAARVSLAWGLFILGYGLRDASRLYRPRNASVATGAEVFCQVSRT